MTPTVFRKCLVALHWTQRGLAEIIGVNEREVRRWAGMTASSRMSTIGTVLRPSIRRP
jgi:hypothetical protein